MVSCDPGAREFYLHLLPSLSFANSHFKLRTGSLMNTDNVYNHLHTLKN